jgi:prepilin-type N-terminal cleavage/methylation domain-containing protein
MRIGHAFTLIELLVCVAVISILASISVGNLQSAHVRAKVSRTHADMRTLTGALEMYRVDHNRYPRMMSARYYGDFEFDYIGGQQVNGVISKVISTPVAYLSNSFLGDPFTVGSGDIPFDEQFYTYQDLDAYTTYSESPFWPAAREFYGDYRIASVGPDRSFDHGFANSAQLPYDATNGTISLGNIWWRAGGPVERLPPIPTLLGEH